MISKDSGSDSKPEKTDRLLTPGMIAAFAFLVVSGLLMALIFSSPFSSDVDRTPDPAALKELEAAASDAGCRLTDPPEEGFNEHTKEPVDYETPLPTSGPHNPDPAESGDYTDQTPPTMDEVVHSLEHGMVAIQFNNIPASYLADLSVLYQEKPKMTLVLANPYMRSQLAATAWGHLLECPGISPKSIEAARSFQEAYINHGPEVVN